MTDAGQLAAGLVAAANTSDETEGVEDTPAGSGEAVGAGDAAADAARSGATDSETGPIDQRDTDGVPVGRDEAAADVERSGGDPRTVL